MSATAKGTTWLAALLLLCHLDCLWCVEEAFLLDQDRCDVKGAEDVRACNWIVEQLEDQNPTLTYDFFCSKEEDCDSQVAEGEVVDWYPEGCNAYKLKDKLCGCCVFTSAPPPVPPPWCPLTAVNDGITCANFEVQAPPGGMGQQALVCAGGVPACKIEEEGNNLVPEDPDRDDCGFDDLSAECIDSDCREATISGLPDNTVLVTQGGPRDSREDLGCTTVENGFATVCVCPPPFGPIPRVHPHEACQFPSLGSRQGANPRGNWGHLSVSSGGGTLCSPRFNPSTQVNNRSGSRPTSRDGTVGVFRGNGYDENLPFGCASAIRALNPSIAQKMQSLEKRPSCCMHSLSSFATRRQYRTELSAALLDQTRTQRPWEGLEKQEGRSCKERTGGPLCAF
eukprot:scaffold770_cov362-Pavlova_lutheri.AAC.20